MKVVAIAPGATTAGSNISLPSYVKASKILGAVKLSLSDATNAGTVTSLTVATTTPSTGEIYLVNESTIQLGDNTTARDVIIIMYIEKGEFSGF